MIFPLPTAAELAIRKMELERTGSVATSLATSFIFASGSLSICDNSINALGSSMACLIKSIRVASTSLTLISGLSAIQPLVSMSGISLFRKYVTSFRGSPLRKGKVLFEESGGDLKIWSSSTLFKVFLEDLDFTVDRLKITKRIHINKMVPNVIPITRTYVYTRSVSSYKEHVNPQYANKKADYGK